MNRASASSCSGRPTNHLGSTVVKLELSISSLVMEPYERDPASKSPLSIEIGLAASTIPVWIKFHARLVSIHRVDEM